MQILIDHNGSDAFYTDAVNMMAQYRSLTDALAARLQAGNRDEDDDVLEFAPE